MIIIVKVIYLFITISAPISTLHFLNQMAHQNGMHLNVCNVTPLDFQGEKINKEKLATKRHGLPGLIYYAIQLYNYNRNNLEDDNVLSLIDKAINRETRCNNITYYKTIIFRDLNHHEIRKYIKQQQNTPKWTTLFGHRRHGDMK